MGNYERTEDTFCRCQQIL
uniref:Uncharacterized protein n=1 Tax=Anguilla anguilla TaxID=7936 RepID=A0A0E9TLJ4_ANGAN